MRVPPSGRVPEQGSDWFLMATEACGGGTPDLGYVLGVSVFIGIFGVGLTSGGSPRRPLQVSWIAFVPKITLPKVSFRLIFLFRETLK